MTGTLLFQPLTYFVPCLELDWGLMDALLLSSSLVVVLVSLSLTYRIPSYGSQRHSAELYVGLSPTRLEHRVLTSHPVKFAVISHSKHGGTVITLRDNRVVFQLTTCGGIETNPGPNGLNNNTCRLLATRERMAYSWNQFLEIKNSLNVPVINSFVLQILEANNLLKSGILRTVRPIPVWISRRRHLEQTRLSLDKRPTNTNIENCIPIPLSGSIPGYANSRSTQGSANKGNKGNLIPVRITYCHRSAHRDRTPKQNNLVSIQPSVARSYNNRDKSHPLLPSICLLNSRSLLPKMDELSVFLSQSRSDIAVVTESWLNPDIDSELLSVAGYNLYHKDRLLQPIP